MERTCIYCGSHTEWPVYMCLACRKAKGCEPAPPKVDRERVVEALKTAFRDGWSDGLSDGHPLSIRSSASERFREWFDGIESDAVVGPVLRALGGDAETEAGRGAAAVTVKEIEFAVCDGANASLEACSGVDLSKIVDDSAHKVVELLRAKGLRVEEVAMGCKRCEHHYSTDAEELVREMLTVAKYHRRSHPDFSLDVGYAHYLANWLLSNRYCINKKLEVREDTDGE